MRGFIIDDLPIFSDGRVAIENERLMLNEVVERKFKGDTVRLKILRKGTPMDVTLNLNIPWPYLMQANQYDIRPRFVVFGGLVFQPLSTSLYSALQTKSVTLRYYYSQFLEEELYLEHPEVIVISKILPDLVNRYMEKSVNAIVDTVNDRPIRTLEDLTEAFKQPVEFYVIKVKGDLQPLVLEAKAVEAARQRIAQQYGVIQEAYMEGSIVPEEWKRESPD